ncbi:DsbA family oxidoreductase, partial [Xanthomonas vesicatoria]|nr:DsbA family oxidoreductase [Xanthomonas vesicatoria]
IQGAQPPEAFTQALLQLAAESVPIGGADA